jgi:hypothetical protein
MFDTIQQNNLGRRHQPLATGLGLAVAVGLLSLVQAGSARAVTLPVTSVTLSWDASTTTNVTAYKIYYGTSCGNYTQVVTADAGTQVTISGLVPGTTYYFAATAADSVGLESDYSNEASFIVPVVLPELGLLRSGTASTLQWPTNFAGYTVQWSSSPLGPWSNLTASASTLGGLYAVTDTAAVAQRFYRLKK